MIANMAVLNWIIAFGAIVLLGLVVRDFWRADKVDSLEQPDNWQSTSGGPDSSGGTDA